MLPWKMLTVSPSCSVTYSGGRKCWRWLFVLFLHLQAWNASNYFSFFNFYDEKFRNVWGFWRNIVADQIFYRQSNLMLCWDSLSIRKNWSFEGKMYLHLAEKWWRPKFFNRCASERNNTRVVQKSDLQYSGLVPSPDEGHQFSCWNLAIKNWLGIYIAQKKYLNAFIFKATMSKQIIVYIKYIISTSFRLFKLETIWFNLCTQ